MTGKRFLALRSLLFVAGGGIIVLAFFLNGGGKTLDRINGFMWVSIALMYLVIFVPFFFSAIRIGNFSAKIPSLVMVWAGVFVYVPLSTAVIILLKTGILTFHVSVIIQTVLVFIFAVNIYFGYFANLHLRNTALEESNLYACLTEIKSKAASLSLFLARLPARYEEIQKTLKRSLDDIKYITPVQNGLGNDGENRILASLEQIRTRCETIAQGGTPPDFETRVDELKALVNERKLLRN
ncbi:MAG: hypothetical protein LBG07_04040 [Treponema sp.]|jgi:hypothetical protein|nr:hypothetical protein [Treponema sp.]